MDWMRRYTRMVSEKTPILIEADCNSEESETEDLELSVSISDKYGSLNINMSKEDSDEDTVNKVLSPEERIKLTCQQVSTTIGYFLVAIVTAFVICAAISTRDQELITAKNFVQITMNGIMTLSIVLILVICLLELVARLKTKFHTERFNYKSEPENYFLKSFNVFSWSDVKKSCKHHICSLVLSHVLTTGSIIYLSIAAHAHFKCLYLFNNIDCNYVNLKVLAFVLIIIYLICQLEFIYFSGFESWVYKQNLYFQYGLKYFLVLCLLLANYSVWIYFTVGEFQEHLSQGSNLSTVPCNLKIPDSISENGKYCFQKGETLYGNGLKEEAGSFLYGFILENCLLSTSIIWHKFISGGKHTRTKTTKKTPRHFQNPEYKNPYCTMIASMSVFVLVIVLLLLYRFNLLGQENFPYLTVMCVFQVLFVLLPNLFAVAVLFINKSNIARSVHYNKFILHMCGTAAWMYYTFNIITGVKCNAVADDTSSKTGLGCEQMEVNLLISVNAFYCVSLFLQILVLKNIDFTSTDFKYYACLRRCIFILAFSNLSLWVTDTFTVNIASSKPVQNVVFGESTWFVILHTIYPFVTFFRLYSFEIFFDFFIK